MEDTRIILLSVKEHIKAALTTAGWSDTGKWVIIKNVEPETRPPVVAIDITDEYRTTYETGNSSRIVSCIVDIEIKVGKGISNYPRLLDLKTQIAKSLELMRIIDFDVKMPGDTGYDAAAQTIAWAHIGESIQDRVVDRIDNTARVSFTLKPDQPI